jgi:hypothetical protein
MISLLRHIRFTLPIVVLLLARPPLCADEPVWEAIADDATLVVRLKAPQAAIKDCSQHAARVVDGNVDGQDPVKALLCFPETFEVAAF